MLNSKLNLPTNNAIEQRKNKTKWNIKHSTSSPDFFTIGYSGQDIDSFLNTLINVNVATLVDVRFTPVSQFKPQFSKNNLKNALTSKGIHYIHKPDWGVPKEIRANSVGKNTRADIWTWYDSNIIPLIIKRNMDEFFNCLEHPVAFMCVEYDPTECHRHRIFIGLEQLGLKGRDL
ncbi:MAG: DUF488 domain-containing protein [Dehalococcoides mccartyi]|uniref:DUF488 domain-containing protein n=1 Tax=Dehalococcoides mccartyi TaxID=61435 RepID=UPI0025C7EDC1|nr:DUF488 domain-containing protein [Dehalococcoides mccartyi]MDN4185457.1 DUF488 domain-containing protein [Dehalococcoides mccartyi]